MVYCISFERNIKGRVVLSIFDMFNAIPVSKCQDIRMIAKISNHIHLVYSQKLRKLCILKICNQNHTDIIKSLPCHSNVISILDSFESNTLHIYYYLFEYHTGGDLNQFLKCHSSILSEFKILKWMTQLLLAVHHLHSYDFLHRDIKSSNIFISKEGNLILGDLGSAVKIQPFSCYSSLTLEGTLSYLAPEIIQSTSQSYEYTIASDVYALGCVFYEMLTRKRSIEL